MASETFDVGRYKLPDEEFWAGDERGVDPMARELVGDYNGVLVDAPTRVNLAERATLPAGIYHLGAIRELAAVRLDRLAAITAMNVSENRLYAAPGRNLERDTDVIERPPIDPAILPDGDMSTTYAADLRELLSLPWLPGRYLITVLLWESASNRATVELVGPPVTKEPEPHPVAIHPPPERNVTTYQQHPHSPAVPSGTGIALYAPRVVDLQRTWRWPLYGSFRLRPLPGENVNDDWTNESLLVEPGFPRPVAVLGIDVVIAGANDGSLDIIRLRVPAYKRAGDEVTGYFGIDLMQLTDLRLPQTYFLTAFSGDSMAGPLPTALVRSGGI